MIRLLDLMVNANQKVSDNKVHENSMKYPIFSLVTPTPFCTIDRDCPDPEKCVDGTCRDACNVDPCGANAICKSRLHASSCTCPIGYTGNPKVQCLKSESLLTK